MSKMFFEPNEYLPGENPYVMYPGELETLDATYERIAETADRLGYRIQAGIFPPSLHIGNYCQRTIGHQGSTGFSETFLTICAIDGKIAIRAHRDDELTQKYKGRIITTHWVESFMEANAHHVLHVETGHTAIPRRCTYCGGWIYR